MSEETITVGVGYNEKKFLYCDYINAIDEVTSYFEMNRHNFDTASAARWLLQYVEYLQQQ